MQHIVNKVVKRRLVAELIFVAVLVTLFFSFRSKPDAAPVMLSSNKIMRFGTFMEIKVISQDNQVGKKAIQGALERLDRIDPILNSYKDDSEISKVNQYILEGPVLLNPELFDLLTLSMDYSRKTDGAFDITVTPLISLWKSAAGENRLPDKDEITAALAKVGYQKVKLTNDPYPQISFEATGMELNVDAIAKGLLVDIALEALKSDEILAAMGDIGGEIACFGQPEPGVSWKIGVQDPFAVTQDDPLAQKAGWIVKLDNCSIATSGNYRQYVKIGDKTYSHIIDPRTGEPADKLPGVTVIAPKPVHADALATAISVMGLEKGMQLIEQTENAEAFIISDDRQTHKSSGFHKYLVR